MGFLDIIRWPFVKMLYWFNEWFGSYALALLFFAIAIKLVLLPLSIKQQKTQIGAAKMRPQIAAIEKKYAGRNDQKTLQKKQQEIMALQQAAGYSPLSGCLPLLIQLPVILILFGIVRSPLTYLCNLTLPGGTNEIQLIANIQNGVTDPTVLGNLGDLTPEAIANAISGVNFNLFGLNLTQTPTLLSWLVIIPILSFAFSFVSMKLSRKWMGNATQAATPENRTSTIIMDLMMPAMSLFFAFSMPAALGVYFIYQSILGMIQQFALAKLMPLPTYTAEEIREMEKAAKERARQNAAQAAVARPGSLHHIDDDDEDIDLDALPQIKSKFDEEDETPLSSPKPKTASSAQNKNKNKKKK